MIFFVGCIIFSEALIYNDKHRKAFDAGVQAQLIYIQVNQRPAPQKYLDAYFKVPDMTRAWYYNLAEKMK